jgi:hypothetical protein
MTAAVLSPEFERRAAIARGAVPGDFGEGWMTSGARDMVRIAAFAGFDIPTLVQRVAVATKHDGMTGPRLVERIMGEMDAEIQNGIESDSRAGVHGPPASAHHEVDSEIQTEQEQNR